MSCTLHQRPEPIHAEPHIFIWSKFCSQRPQARLIHAIESPRFQVAALVQADKERGFGDVKLEALLDWHILLLLCPPCASD